MKDKIVIDLRIASLAVIAILLGIIGFLGYQLYFASPITGAVSLGNQKSVVNVMPTGVPKVYGTELSLSYDDVAPTDPNRTNNAIYKMAVLDQNINLTGSNLERYIKIASNISCEYCCGAKAIIFSDGQPACGCAHSFAMRGLAKYLITEHGTQYTDDQILEELGKWKTLFFPEQITAKAKILSDKGIQLNYINLASNKYRGIEKGSSGGMVGGC